MTTPAHGSLLELVDVSVHYGGVKALRGVSMTVGRGEVVALIGANGAGKTTTLKAVLGLLPLAGGSVRFGDKDLAGTTTEERVMRGISLVPEGRAIFPNLTVRENLEVGAYTHRDPAAMSEIESKVTSLFPRLGERMFQDAGTLSGGEQQMLAIGRALMARPVALLLDEPSLGIAPSVVQQIYTAILGIASAGVSVLVVEQNTRMALEVSQRTYVLETGEVRVSGKSSELEADPGIQRAYLG